MTNKVKVPREIAETIEELRNDDDWSDNDLLDFAMINRRGCPTLETLDNYIHKVDYAKYAKAIINGYEVEEKVDDRLQERYIAWRNEGCPQPFYDAVMLLSEKYPELKGVLDGD